ncbi:hypothetical protein [Rhodococcus sp. SJ-2]
MSSQIVPDNQTATIYSLIVEALDDHGLVDPRDIAEKVAAVTPDDVMRSHFATALVGEVRSIISDRRSRAITNALAPKSRKVAGIRDWWAEMLAARVHVGESKWMTIGECGAKELRFAADERRRDAERELKRAEAFDQLRSLLRQHKTETVADLPRDAAAAIIHEVVA